MAKLTNYFILSLLIAISVVTNASADNVADGLTEIMTDTGFNGAILVQRNDELVYEHYRGMADADKGQALASHHLFSPGSVGKEFTTVALMLLEHQGRVSFDDKVSDYLPFLPEWGRAITVFQLLNHTSGLPKIKWHANITTQDAIEQVKTSTSEFMPGEGYTYSNLNVVVRALLIEKVTNTRFSHFLQTHIFAPAKMTASYVQLTRDEVSEHKVTGDYPTFLNGVTIYVTPRDLLRFEDALTSGVYMPFASLQRTLAFKGLSGEHNRAAFDFGSYYTNDRGQLTGWQHDGSNPSHHTLKYHDFAHNLMIILMSSDGNKSTLYQIKDTIIENLINADE